MEGFFGTAPVERVQAFFGPGHPEIFRVLSQAGTTWGVVVVVAVALWVWGRRDAYALIGIVLGEAAVTMALNQVLAVPRPSGANIIKYEHVPLGSFPSGHVFVTTVLWGLLWMRGRVPAWLLAVVVTAVAVSRLYLGVHYLEDVVGGAVGGLLLVWGYHRLWPRVERRLAAWRYRTWVAVGTLAGLSMVAAYLSGFLGTNPFKWHAAGLVLAGVPALLLEWRFVRYEPGRHRTAHGSGTLAAALLVLVALAATDRGLGEDPLALSAALLGAGAVWGWLLAPAWFSSRAGTRS